MKTILDRMADTHAISFIIRLNAICDDLLYMSNSFLWMQFVIVSLNTWLVHVCWWILCSLCSKCSTLQMNNLCNVAKIVHVWNVVALDFTARPTSLNLNFSLNSRLSGGGLSLPTTAAAGNSQDSKSKFYMLVDGKSKTISVLRYYPLQYNFLVFRVLLLSNRDTWVSILKIRTAKA